ncbi:DNA (cytosine-5)-methyltransferase 1 [Actinokineospora baliensis]|uniref:DNA cytosine methyltransferase n=1 Tax=Actinokineospora baliensis TaxID=547056 RepID=UPI00195B5C68|nr:DNA cytosine methyltransferase [Actinokineospora baliensis]MBM7770613.1 DNA (cytosine-5)-methyltransferase 1 [Actinokineospora baliensis]
MVDSLTGPVASGSLCSGYGGLDLGVAAVLDLSPRWFADIAPAAVAAHARHWPGLPNLGDIRTVRWDTVEPVSILTAGYPCQPFSTAGLMKGESDDRHLWPHIAQAVRVLRPGVVFLENVSGHRSRGLGAVLADLAAMRLRVGWESVRASAAGAPHRRERVFILAADPGHRDVAEWARRARRAVGQRQAERQEPDRRRTIPVRAPDDEWAEFTPAVRHWEHLTGRPAPPPTIPGPRNTNVLAPAFMEWLMGLPAGFACDLDGFSRPDLVSLLGNGVVPQQATHAFVALMTALFP